jgi:hypothetical protein
MKKIPGKYLLIGGIGLLVVVAFSSTYYFYSKLQGTEKLLSNTELATQKEVVQLVEKVGRLMELPTGEAPTIATVSDKEKLADQAFFQNAQNGDKVLIFTGVKKAILYRPSTDKIIEVAPINIGGEQTSTQQTVPQTIRVTMYNGTFTAGLAKTTADNITTKFPNMTVIAKKDAGKKDYQKTLVVDLTGNLKQQANDLAVFLNAEVSALPENERKPDGELLVILGQAGL